MSRAYIVAALRRANRRDVKVKATAIQQTLSADQLRQPRPVQAAYAAIVTSQVQIINILNVDINEMWQVTGATILAGTGTLTAT